MLLARTSLLVGVLVLAGCATASPGPGGTSSGPPAGGTSSSPSPGPSGYAITGVVTAEPGCPGPQRGGTPCPPRPVAGARVELAKGGAIVETQTADGAGRFQFIVAPGSYRVTAHNVGLASQASQDVTVTADPVDLKLVVDSGLR
jgi:hypothetical protein